MPTIGLRTRVQATPSQRTKRKGHAHNHIGVMQGEQIFPTSPVLFPPTLLPGASSMPIQMGPNDGGIKRGDREDTGDNEAEPTETGSGWALPTVDPRSLGGESSIRQPSGAAFDLEEERSDNDGLEIMEANDGRLGLTNVGDVPADDWAADTGETKTPEGSR